MSVVLAQEITREEYLDTVSDVLLLKELVKKLESSIHEEFSTSRSLILYDKEYDTYIKDLRGRISSRKKLSDQLKKSSVILFGDEHSNPRSQENVQWILRQIGQDHSRPTILAIEWIEKKYQKYIDMYMSYQMNDREFRSAIEFDRLWGFSWKEHIDILKLARKMGLEVKAAENRISSDGNSSVSLKRRDQNIVNNLVSLKKNRPDVRLLLVYGYTHLVGKGGAGHLSEKLSSRGLSPDTVVLPSSNGEYYRLLGETLNKTKTEVLQFSSVDYYLHQGGVNRRLDILGYYFKQLRAGSKIQEIKSYLKTYDPSRSCKRLFY